MIVEQHVAILLVKDLLPKLPHVISRTLTGPMTKHVSKVLLSNLLHSQHISNTIWGMAKMDSSWDLIPGRNLERALVRASKLLTPQEVRTLQILCMCNLQPLEASGSIGHSRHSLLFACDQNPSFIIRILHLRALLMHSSSAACSSHPAAILPPIASPLNSRQTANVLYGLAVLDAKWTSLSIDTQISLCAALERTVSSMTNQVQ